MLSQFCLAAHLSCARPSPLPLVSTPILPLQWTCIAFGAAGSRWRWHHLHCSTLQHWVWTKTSLPLTIPSLTPSISLSIFPPHQPESFLWVPSSDKLSVLNRLSTLHPIHVHMLVGEERQQAHVDIKRDRRQRRQCFPPSQLFTLSHFVT